MVGNKQNKSKIWSNIFEVVFLSINNGNTLSQFPPIPFVQQWVNPHRIRKKFSCTFPSILAATNDWPSVGCGLCWEMAGCEEKGELPFDGRKNRKVANYNYNSKKSHME